MKLKRSLLYTIFAIILLLASLRLPFWTVIMDAPTYPERNLSMRVYLNYLEGDLREWNVVGNLVGVKVPPPIPDEAFVIVPILMGLLILLCIGSLFLPKLKKAAAYGPWVIITVLTLYTQYSLYLFGHDLDPNRPLRYIEPFTPPVIGVKKIGTMLTYHLPHVGSFLLVGAGILLIMSYLQFQKENRLVETTLPT